MRFHPPPPASRVLDLGCGFGDMSLELATRIGPEGEIIGVDCAERFIAAAEQDAAAARVKNVRFVVADIENDALGGPYDQAFSRFGTMFFASPFAALRNIRRALKSDGQLVMVVWRKREDNPWLHIGELCVRKLVDVPEAADGPTCGPGPFSMAGADGLSDVLQAAGYRRIALERHDTDIMIGRDLPEAVAFALALGPAGEIIRLAGAAAEARRPELTAALSEALAGFVRSDGVYAPSSAWIVTSRTP